MSDEFTDEPIGDSPALKASFTTDEPLSPALDADAAPVTRSKAPVHEDDDEGIVASATQNLSLNDTKTNKELYIHSKVSQPQKEADGQNAFISYLIETESNNPVFQQPKFIVRRRFSDFYFLYQVLLSDYPACAVPPLPDKQRLEYLKGDRFGPEFTMKRASSLTRFLQRLSRHPILKRAKIYHIFLESMDWNSYRAHLKTKVHNDTSMSADGVTDVFMNAFKHTTSQSKEFVDIKERSDKLDENINKIDRIMGKILKRYADLEQDYYDFSQQMKKLGELEPELQVPFVKFSEGLNDLSLGFQSLKTFLDNEYIISLKDLEHYITSIKNLLKLKDQKQIDYEALTEYLHKSETERQTLMAGGGSNFFSNKLEELRGVNHDAARREKLTKLDHRIESLTKESEVAKNVCEQFEKQTLLEIQYFENIKAMELKSTLGELADSNIAFYKGLIDKWSQIEKELKQ